MKKISMVKNNFYVLNLCSLHRDNGEQWRLLHFNVEKKYKKGWYFPLNYCHFYLPFVSYLSIYHKYLFVRRANVLHEYNAGELRVCGLMGICIHFDPFSKVNQLRNSWKVQISCPAYNQHIEIHKLVWAWQELPVEAFRTVEDSLQDSPCIN